MGTTKTLQLAFSISLAAALLPAAPVFCSGSDPAGPLPQPGAEQDPGGQSTAPSSGDKSPLPMARTVSLSSAPALEPFGAAVMPYFTPPLPQEYCFSLLPRTPTADDPVPFHLIRTIGVPPECEKMEAILSSEPAHQQFSFSAAFTRCWRWTTRYAGKKLALAKELSASRKEAAACCPGISAGRSGPKTASCDEKCLEAWEKKLRALSREFEGVEKLARADLNICFAGAIPHKRKSDGK